MKILNNILKAMKVPGFRDKDNEYKNNPDYAVRRSLFREYNPKSVKIVMLGDSITQAPDWNELLGRTDVVNRGISGDITQGFISRMKEIYKLNPEFCLIMGGINDITKNLATVDEICRNYEQIVTGLIKKYIKPVIQSTIYVAAGFDDAPQINIKVKELNSRLVLLAEKHNAVFINVNSVLATDDVLKPEFTYDELHLLGSGYAKWRDLLLDGFLKTV
ncbi:MAG: GDSL family lipase [Spirochaetes bacterium]|nr:GDSL family lipase [Spirochaetota bacterium]